jgi:hypothetical protein
VEGERTSMPTLSSCCFLDLLAVGDLGSVVLESMDVSPGGAVVVGDVGAAVVEAVDFRGIL